MITTGYHSVHLAPEPAEPRNWWTDGLSVAFVRDVTRGPELPEEYQSCDLLYAELPWRSGYERYQVRAGGVSAASDWPEFMTRVHGLIAGWQKPAVIVAGLHARSRMPAAGQELPVRLLVAGRQAALAFVYNAGFTTEWADTEGLLRYLAARFGRVGDFCAGYGRAPRAFTLEGGSFVASDINPRCIGYIAEHAADWPRKG